MKKMVSRLCTVVAVTLPLTTPVHAENLNDAVQHALLFNPDLLFQTAKRLSTAQGAREAKGAMYGSVDLRAGVGREKSLSPTTVTINGTQRARSLWRRESSIEYNQPVFAGGSLFNEYIRNLELHNAEVYKQQGVADDVALATSEVYLNVLKGHQLVKEARHAVEQHEKIMSMIEQRSSAGVSREAENEQAIGRLALSKANLVSEISNLRESYISYVRIVGKSPKDLAWPRVPSSRNLPRNLDQAVTLSVANHPTLKSAFADVEEARSQHKVALGANYPRVDLVLSASRNEDLDGLVGINQDNLAMLRVTYNIFRGGSDLAKQRKTAYQMQEAYEVKNRAYEQVKESIRLSWNSLQTAQDRMGYLSSYRTAAGRTLDAYNEQFKVGKRTLLDLLDQVNENYQARIDYLEGLYQEVFSRYRVLNSTGRLVPYLGVHIPNDVQNSDHNTSHQFFEDKLDPPRKVYEPIELLTAELEQHLSEKSLATVAVVDAETQMAKVKELDKQDLTLASKQQQAPQTTTQAASPTPSASKQIASNAQPTGEQMTGKGMLRFNENKQTTIAGTETSEQVIADKQRALDTPDATVARASVPAIKNAKPTTVAAKQKGKPVRLAKQWYIQAGAFSTQYNADRVRNRLSNQGFKSAFIEGDKGLHHVYLGPFKYRGDAKRTQADLVAKSGVDAILRYKTITVDQQRQIA